MLAKVREKPTCPSGSSCIGNLGDGRADAFLDPSSKARSYYNSFLLLVAIPFSTSRFLLLVAKPGATSSVLADAAACPNRQIDENHMTGHAGRSAHIERIQW